MSLQSFTDSLPKSKQFDLAIKLTRLALPIWNQYANKNELTYFDSVVGMKHSVDKLLLEKAIVGVEEYLRLNKLKSFFGGNGKLLELRKQFDDPIAAMQDTDWELPDEAQKIFYSVYNLVETSLGKERTLFNESSIYVSINQAVDALEKSKMLTTDEISTILDGMKNDR